MLYGISRLTASGIYKLWVGDGIATIASAKAGTANTIALRAERRLLSSRSSNGRQAARSRERSPLTSLITSRTCDLIDGNNEEDEEADYTDDYAEDELVDDSENACLLYDATTPMKASMRIGELLETSGDWSRSNPYFAISRGEPPTTQPPRITFSDTVRISGGVRSSTTEIRDARRSSGSGRSLVHHHASPYVDGPVASVSTSMSANSSHAPSLSRAASYRSEVSRASTPASLYAPLLMPSKTAPSPSRTFYLTFSRPSGVTTYRELVKRQEVARENRNMKRRPKGAKKWWCAWLTRSTADVEDCSDNAREDDRENLSFSRAKTKSEMQVLFGSAPWRWIKVSYWLYKLRHICRTGKGLDTDEEQQ